MRLRTLAVAAAAGMVAGAVALGGPAAAGHNAPELTVGEPGDCGETTFSTEWIEETHRVNNTVLVVQAAGDQHVADIGTPITVGPFDTETATIRYRIWGGGERDYDNPPLTDLSALLDHLDGGGSPLDAEAPGVAWHETTVKGCPPDPEPTATGAGDSASDEELAATGASLPRLLIAGGLLLLAGVAGLVLARRRGISTR